MDSYGWLLLSLVMYLLVPRIAARLTGRSLIDVFARQFCVTGIAAFALGLTALIFGAR